MTFKGMHVITIVISSILKSYLSSTRVLSSVAGLGLKHRVVIGIRTSTELMPKLPNKGEVDKVADEVKTTKTHTRSPAQILANNGWKAPPPSVLKRLCTKTPPPAPRVSTRIKMTSEERKKKNKEAARRYRERKPKEAAKPKTDDKPTVVKKRPAKKSSSSESSMSSCHRSCKCKSLVCEDGACAKNRRFLTLSV